MRFSVWLEETAVGKPSLAQLATRQRVSPEKQPSQRFRPKPEGQPLPDDFWDTYMPPKREAKPSAVPPSNSAIARRKPAPKPESGWEKWLKDNPDEEFLNEPDPDMDPDFYNTYWHKIPDKSYRLVGSGGRRLNRPKIDDDEYYNYEID